VNISAQATNFRSSLNAASKTQPQAQTETNASCQIQDLMVIGEEKPTAEKEQIIRSMIRQAPDCHAVTEVVEALSAYPTDALKRVQAFGTKLEIYDKDENGDGQEFPNYRPTLVHPLVNGAYNTRANVLGIEEDNLSPFVLLHEFAHALDASMGNISEQPEWKGAYKLACNTNQVVRDYAKQDPSEYFAENTSAFLVSDEALYTLVDEGLQKGIGLNGMDEHEYMKTYQNFCKGRVERVDSNGYRLVDTLLHSLDSLPAAKPQPAMDQKQWQEFINQRAA
jgi:hypothetical protein